MVEAFGLACLRDQGDRQAADCDGSKRDSNGLQLTGVDAELPVNGGNLALEPVAYVAQGVVELPKSGVDLGLHRVRNANANCGGEPDWQQPEDRAVEREHVGHAALEAVGR